MTDEQVRFGQGLVDVTKLESIIRDGVSVGELQAGKNYLIVLPRTTAPNTARDLARYIKGSFGANAVVVQSNEPLELYEFCLEGTK